MRPCQATRCVCFCIVPWQKLLFYLQGPLPVGTCVRHQSCWRGLCKQNMTHKRSAVESWREMQLCCCAASCSALPTPPCLMSWSLMARNTLARSSACRRTVQRTQQQPGQLRSRAEPWSQTRAHVLLSCTHLEAGQHSLLVQNARDLLRHRKSTAATRRHTARTNAVSTARCAARCASV